MSYDLVNLSAVETIENEEGMPAVRPVGYELRPEKMRFNVWELEPGDTLDEHRHERQEELYVVLSGALELDVENESVDLRTGDYVIVAPEAWRELRATQPSRLLAVGAPNARDDGMMADTADDSPWASVRADEAVEWINDRWRHASWSVGELLGTFVW